MTRKQERIELNQSIIINDVINGGIFGEVVNVTTEGLMVMADINIPKHAVYQLSLQLPTSILGSDSIELGVEFLWCKVEENCDRHWAGAKIIDASEQAISQLVQLIEDYKK